MTPSLGNAQFEWETRDEEVHRRHFDPTLEQTELSQAFDARKPVVCYGDFGGCPYPENRYARGFAEVARVATVNEPVTFRNVPVLLDDNSEAQYNVLKPDKLLTAVTPSGVRIQLVPGAVAGGLQTGPGNLLGALSTFLPRSVSTNASIRPPLRPSTRRRFARSIERMSN